MGCGKSLAKILVILINGVLAAGALVMLVFGALLKFKPDIIMKIYTEVKLDELLKNERVKELVESSVAPSIGIAMMVAGAVILVIALLGFCGACKSSKCLLVLYIIFVSLLLAAQLAAVVAYWTLKDKFLETLGTELQKLANKYDTDTSYETMWDLLHVTFKCCGVNGMTTWAFRTAAVNTPASCCSNGIACAATPVYHSKGCLDKLTDTLDSSKNVVLGVSIAIMVLQLLLAISAGVLCRADKDD